MLILLMENILPQVQHEIFRDSVQLNSTYTCLPPVWKSDCPPEPKPNN